MRMPGGSEICPGIGSGFTIGLGLTLMMLAAVAGAAEGGATAAGAAAKVEDHVSSGHTAISYDDFYRGVYTERYRRRTEMLEKESLEESLRLLSRAAMYDERMIMMSSGITGFRGMEKVSIWKILKNRRFAKVQGELRALPAGEAAALINRELKSAMEDYRRVLERQIGMAEKNESSTEAESGLAFIPDVMVIHEDDSYEGLEGMTLKVQALLLLAGEIGRAGCASEIAGTVTESIRLRDAVAANDSLTTMARSHFNQWSGLMSPRIMTTALLRANHPEMTMEDAARPFGIYSRNHVSDESWPGIFWIVDEMREEKFAKVLRECLPEVGYTFESREGLAHAEARAREIFGR